MKESCTRSRKQPNEPFSVDTLGLWAFRRQPNARLAYALPKRKKDFKAGRPIISFVDAFMRPLLEATSRLLHRLCSIAFPQAFEKGGVYELLSQVQGTAGLSKMA